MVREGRIGEVERVEAWCPDISTQYDDFKVYQYGSLRPAPPPADLYYDLWCGPSPLRPYTVDRCTEFGAYHIHDYALGFIAGWGAHPLDIAQWGLNADDTSPVFYEGGGSLPDYGLTDTTETWDITCYYDSGVLMRFMSHRVAQPVVMKYRKRWSSHGTTFFGKEGWISVDRGGLESSNESLAKFQMPNDGVKEYDRSEHQRNFIDCVRNHKQPVSPLEAGIRSDTISHLSDIVVRLKRPIQWDPKREAIVGDEEASKMLDRPMRKRWRI